MRRTLPILAALLALSIPALAQTPATDRALRTTVGVSDPLAARFWPDVIAQASKIQLAYAPLVNITEATDRFGRRITVTQFMSGITCGAQACSTRIYIDGNLQSETLTCGEWDQVKLAADATFLDSCGSRVDIPTKLPE